MLETASSACLGSLDSGFLCWAVSCFLVNFLIFIGEQSTELERAMPEGTQEMQRIEAARISLPDPNVSAWATD